jgi:hypothetical protein
MEYGDPIKAEVTWNGSKSYRFAGNSQLIFKDGKTRILTDTELIKRCQTTHGFAVLVLQTYKPKKKIRPVAKKRNGSSSKADKESSKKKTKKTTKRYSSDD